MDAAQIAAMIADINVGTEPHWWRDQLEFYLDEDNGYSDQKTADYRRIARVPNMEATIIAQAAELERLRAALDVSDKYWRGENITPSEVILAIRAALEAKP